MKIAVNCILIVCLVALTACAKRPMSCKKLAQNKSKTQSQLDSMSAEQNSALTKDDWGVFWDWGPDSPARVAGDREAAISVAKGQIDAIELTEITQDCL